MHLAPPRNNILLKYSPLNVMNENFRITYLVGNNENIKSGLKRNVCIYVYHHATVYRL